MISERTFAESYRTFWMECTPLLPDYCASANGRGRRFGRAIDLPEKSFHVSFNNIIATTHFKNVDRDPEYAIEQSYNDSIPVLSIFAENYLDKYTFSEDYKKIVRIQAERLTYQYSGTLIHDPEFPGYGLITNCKGDLLCGTTLVEIKANTGKRYNKPFENKDFRQLLIYCALNHLAGNLYDIQRINLFNPRMGFLWQSGVEEFIYEISGSTSIELFNTIGNFLQSLSEGFTDSDY